MNGMGTSISENSSHLIFRRQQAASGAVSMAASETWWALVSVGLRLRGLKSFTNCQNVLTNESICNDFGVLFLPAR